MELSIFGVKSISLSAEMLLNRGMRKLRIENDDGVVFELVVYGNTSAFSDLPKWSGYRDYDGVKKDPEVKDDGKSEELKNVWVSIRDNEIVGTPFGPEVPNGKYMFVGNLKSEAEGQS